MASVKRRPNGKWRARYRDETGKEHARHFDTKREGERWLTEQTAAVLSGTHVDPSRSRLTIREWSETWLKGYARNRPSSVKSARTHLGVINRDLGSRVMRDLRPSDVTAWVVSLQERGLKPAYIHNVHRRLAQLYIDAIHDGLVTKSPCSRRTSPPTGRQRAYVITTEQVWAIYAAVPENVRPAVLLGAFAGLRISEAVALRVQDVDFEAGIVYPTVQYPNAELKTPSSRTPVPIPLELRDALLVNVKRWGSETLVVNSFGLPCSPHLVADALRHARPTIAGLAPTFGFHDFRHYFASLLIAAGLDIKTVQARMRHSSAQTTLDTYGHMWPDKDEASREAVSAILRTPGGLRPL